MTDEYTEKTTGVSASVQNYGRYTDTKLVTGVKAHECHCAPDAPCRISGRCTCMNSLSKSPSYVSSTGPHSLSTGTLGFRNAPSCTTVHDFQTSISILKKLEGVEIK